MAVANPLFVAPRPLKPFGALAFPSDWKAAPFLAAFPMFQSLWSNAPGFAGARLTFWHRGCTAGFQTRYAVDFQVGRVCERSASLRRLRINPQT